MPPLAGVSSGDGDSPGAAARPAAGGPLDDGEPTAGASPRPGSRRHERRRGRVALAVVPGVVVAATTTLALQYFPHTSEPSRDRALPTPAGTVTSSPAAPATGGPAPGDRPSESEGKRSSSPPGKGEDGQGGGAPGGFGSGATDGWDAPDAEAGPASGGSAAGGSASGGSGSGGSASGGSGSGGSETPGGTGPAPTTAPAPVPATSPHHYRNGDDGTCLTQVYGAATTGGCSGSSATWTVRSVSGGFRLVNQQNGGCLSAGMPGQAVFANGCGDSVSQVWRAGSGGSLVSVANGGCLDLGMTDVVTATCTGRASQRWSEV
ncbi:hypothetical protein OQI_03530 [Streptomyces pharetrae CZA14]|uniref:Ricin B lectin domain-containing protein n=1 Tax=Streptomyces pharetrae CZA14 TaxID=1144883 RepID=A0ABX3YPA9_9ACTN|nr:hypothetical protein OQI_03530 [Streptomyces pharetrae CZA14]